jgi:SPP1 family phage portal protein
MTLEQINALVLAGSTELLVAGIKKTRPNFDFSIIKKQYDVRGHAIFDQAERPDKVITNANGGTAKVVKVTRLGFPLQKKIVQTAAAFLCGNPIKLDAGPKDDSEINYLKLPQKIWDDNKLDYKSLTLAELRMSETECAELWYNPEEPGYWNGYAMKSNFKLKMRILANSCGDNLYPVFDATGDLIAFGRGYNVADEEGKQIEYFDLYTPTQIVKSIKTPEGWVTSSENNIAGKIPIIYYGQPAVEWADVQEMIARIETKGSNHADTNDYFDSPVLVTEGKAESMPDKQEEGKMIEIEVGGKVYYVTWDLLPESMKLELDNLWKWIHTNTSTPDISFESMKSLGNAPSGYAIELMFLSAHLKAARIAQTGFGESIQRRINYIQAWLAAVDKTQEKFLSLSIKPKFEYFLPSNNAEKIDILNNAVMGGLMSKETAVRQNPLIEDADTEIALLEGENSAASQLDQLMNDGGKGKTPIKTPLK